ncbi:hypothetical protein, partial [Micromonospora sp. NPDC051296]|uniref:hypothetical protein n=1 Tax=Micromonospora sp. NPDC051296 TaxID=3155046 RepID=UPI0034207BC9
SAYCQQVLTVVPRALGPRVGKQVQQVIKAGEAQALGVDPIINEFSTSVIVEQNVEINRMREVLANGK